MRAVAADFAALRRGKVTPGEFVAQLTDALVCGTGWGVTDDANPVIGASSESVPGAAGETTHCLEHLCGR